ncbi:NAD(P)-dependent alcohol dehydrogenase [Umezawaea endophytica]|uniref:NAD(P)-dependent alcohol dehydrogenase n=1 Tax=Umezawaea endophytica TaxID=1654476 RepID=A0A9X2VSF6_9PSEU|nr:NAD(P)-dependent alcohol dehydrogenase [Umezawaea endophytica]MCS7482028.1 NAD(P)-dependent alcohol dehydrogenase [Umezawaea endophytica]
MKAIVQHRYGSPDVLELKDVPQPVPGPGELLVRVRAAAVNAYDWHFMRGDPYLARLSMGLRGPKERVRGRDFAGVVEAVGDGAVRFAVGDEVYGEVDGTFAEYVRVSELAVGVKPAGLTFEQAAAVPLAGNTALIGVRDLGRVTAGQRVLVNGASGGVGTFAVQIAKAHGAEVTGVCSTRNVDLVRELGADHVVDYRSEDFARSGKRYDVVLDFVANRSLADHRRVLTPGGTLVLAGGGVSEGGSFLGPIALLLKALVVRPFMSQRVCPLTAVNSAENLAVLGELVESGQVTPVIDRGFTLEEAAEAIRYVEVEHARAKVVITV